MLHVMFAKPAADAPKGLCGAAVKDFYISKVPADGILKLDLCPVCRALALKTKSSDGVAETESTTDS